MRKVQIIWLSAAIGHDWLRIKWKLTNTALVQVYVLRQMENRQKIAGWRKKFRILTAVWMNFFILHSLYYLWHFKYCESKQAIKYFLYSSWCCDLLFPSGLGSTVHVLFAVTTVLKARENWPLRCHRCGSMGSSTLGKAASLDALLIECIHTFGE